MFLSCGEALFDLFPSSETDTGFLFDARIGGSPFNVAIGSRAWGVTLHCSRACPAIHWAAGWNGR